ncbi:phosphoribosyltransferase [Anaeromyxobacter oryzae]|uniref:Phosphoribosyltransferase n=1 Tax=Anaeromyxobacter oryzae TaxID=2918170 RepID=A0ABM7WRZ9_9BACT|nr:phosphoribosyltransferase family protein [Anaeromyxobacter oryzae]BDG02262.1 phosphoribosyltransferase [Anaeromyxobacter oryzae]
MRFHDRGHAGRLLAERLEHLAAAHPVVLGLTRGGIPVAFEVARVLEAPLDLIVVRKLGALAPSAGAIAEGGVLYLNPTYLRDARLDPDDAASLADADVIELAKRVRLYRAEFPASRLGGRTAIVVDDFVATGTTARAAARAARRRGAARVVLAVPVLAAGVEQELREDFDEVIALALPPPGEATSAWYERLEPASDDVAMELLRRARLEWRAEAPAPVG